MFIISSSNTIIITISSIIIISISVIIIIIISSSSSSSSVLLSLSLLCHVAWFDLDCVLHCSCTGFTIISTTYVSNHSHNHNTSIIVQLRM